MSPVLELVREVPEIRSPFQVGLAWTCFVNDAVRIVIQHAFHQFVQLLPEFDTGPRGRKRGNIDVAVAEFLRKEVGFELVCDLPRLVVARQTFHNP